MFNPSILRPVLFNRIRSDLTLLAGSGSGYGSGKKFLFITKNFHKKLVSRRNMQPNTLTGDEYKGKIYVKNIRNSGICGAADETVMNNVHL